VIETWLQWTCDGCGDTEHHAQPNVSKSAVREYLKGRGWRNYGSLDYCPKCVQNGNASRRETDMNH